MPARMHYLETDGSVRPGEHHRSRDWPSVGGAGIVLFGPGMEVLLTESIHLGEVSGSVEAEFRAALSGLRRARDRRVNRLRLRSDSLPVIQHLSGAERLDKRWAAEANGDLLGLLAGFELFEARWTPSSHALERRRGVPTADALARRAVGLSPR